jgi:hypothetical protein
MSPHIPLAQRLWHDMAAQLAARVGCCPIHGTRLVCALCDVVWTASPSVERETDALMQRTALYQMTWPTWPCGHCHTPDSAMCIDCYEPVREQAFVGLTPEEEARYAELLARTMRYTFLPEPSDDGRERESHERGETP